jgi:hypothetical protein
VGASPNIVTRKASVTNPNLKSNVGIFESHRQSAPPARDLASGQSHRPNSKMNRTHESWAIGSNKMGVHPVRKSNFHYGYEKGRDFGTTKFTMQDGPITVFKN